MGRVVRQVLDVALGGEAVTAGTALETAGDPADGGDADTGAVVDFPVGHALLEQGDDAPAVAQRFELGGRAKVVEEGAQLRRLAKAQQGSDQGIEVGVVRAGGGVTAFHGRANVITRYYIVKKETRPVRLVIPAPGD